MPKLPIDYSKALIYKIVCKDLNIKDCYVGSTTDFRKRKTNHKADCNNANGKNYNFNVYKFIRENGGWDNWTIVLIENYPCENKLELLKRERELTEQLNGNLNSVRNQGIKKQLGEQYSKIKSAQYYIANIDKIKEKKRKYCEKNADKIKETKRKYRVENADKIKQHKSQKHICGCGSEYSLCHKLRHERTQKHQDYINNSILKNL